MAGGGPTNQGLWGILTSEGAMALGGALVAALAGGVGWLIRRPQRQRHATLDVVSAMGELVDGLKAQNDALREELADARAELSAVHLKLNEATRDLVRAERRISRIEAWMDDLPGLIRARCPSPDNCPVLRVERPNGSGKGDGEASGG